MASKITRCEFGSSAFGFCPSGRRLTNRSRYSARRLKGQGGCKAAQSALWELSWLGTPPSFSLRGSTDSSSRPIPSTLPAPLACPLYPPNRQSHGNRHSREREGWESPEGDQRHRERR